MPLGGKIAYAVACLAFRSFFPEGIAADNVRKTRLGFFPRLFIRAAIAMTRGTRDWFGIRPRREAIDVA
jgi:hypothetical protein